MEIRYRLEPLLFPLGVANELSRKTLLSEFELLKSSIKLLDKKSFKRKCYRYHAWGWSYRARASLLAYRMFGNLEHVEAVLEGEGCTLPIWGVKPGSAVPTNGFEK
jgi:hypothetical protein